jgi:hypothetical protein
MCIPYVFSPDRRFEFLPGCQLLLFSSYHPLTYRAAPQTLSLPGPLALFRVNVFPLGILSQDHTSFVVNSPKYIAVNQQDQLYLKFSERPTLEKEKFYFFGSEQHAMLSKERHTCILSLFLDNVVDINRFCETNLRPFSRQPSAHYLGDKLLMLQNIATYSVTDYNHRTWQVQTNCTTCLITVSCEVKIQADKYTLFIPSCAESASSRDTVNVSHLANLQLIAPLINADLMAQLSAEYTFQTPFILTLPRMIIYQKGKMKPSIFWTNQILT